MKIFAMNDCDWMAAEDAESAKSAYISDDGEDSDQPPIELTDEEMDKFRFADEDVRDPEKWPTFRQDLQRRIASGQEFPQFFASTDF